MKERIQEKMNTILVYGPTNFEDAQLVKQTIATLTQRALTASNPKEVQQYVYELQACLIWLAAATSYYNEEIRRKENTSFEITPEILNVLGYKY